MISSISETVELNKSMKMEFYRSIPFPQRSQQWTRAIAKPFVGVSFILFLLSIYYWYENMSFLMLVMTVHRKELKHLSECSSKLFLLSFQYNLCLTKFLFLLWIVSSIAFIQIIMLHPLHLIIVVTILIESFRKSKSFRQFRYRINKIDAFMKNEIGIDLLAENEARNHSKLFRYAIIIFLVAYADHVMVFVYPYLRLRNVLKLSSWIEIAKLTSKIFC